MQGRQVERKFLGRSDWSCQADEGEREEIRTFQAEGTAGAKAQNPTLCVLCSVWHG